MIAPQTDTIIGIYKSWLLVGLEVNLAIILYITTVAMVGRARARYKVMPPATTGHPDFERYYRVQQNTLEQLVPFVPSLLMFAGIWQAPRLAACIGALWLIGRVWYAVGYYKETNKRLPGFVIAMLSTVFLALGSLVGILKTLF